MLRSFKRCLFAAVLGWTFFQPASADFEEDYERMPWQEMAVQLPPAPRQEALLPFYVSAATNNNFFVDEASLTIGEDGVVRYVLVVTTEGGARNVSYEGIRCLTRERRIYASGRPDGGWSRSRNNQWEPIRDRAANRQHAALHVEYFCPGGVMVKTSEEARNSLRAGVHPLNRR